ncbi:metal-dependent hydrolase [Paludifilum halophilum]|uniref:metal-dependent hydrolase n=1 Tax=Paludifilum halophilum TaxID=1642702 RepID=UPI001F0AEAA7|nr:metal-dependent hydrolase [Paludifilum halophilum]
MHIQFHGQSCFEIHHEGTRLIIDPFLKGNPKAKSKPEDIKTDYILLTHGHGDHVGDTVEIAKRNGATVIAPFELANWIGWQGVDVHPMHIGGAHSFDFGRVKLTPAFHGSGFIDEENKEIIYLGMPAGILLMLGEKTIYHAGDTALFSDMKLIGMKSGVDLAFLPIGDNFTMGPEDALLAAEWVGANTVIPMHYNTFPLIEQDGEDFVRRLKEKGIDGVALEVGNRIEF